MLTRFRRSAAVLLVLFTGHLSLVMGGAVCVTPGMADMSATPAASDAMVGMPGMDAQRPASTNAVSNAGKLPSDSGTHSPAAPCSAPSQGTCVASMPCVTALGAPPADALAGPLAAPVSLAETLTVAMPASPGSAPDLPPPRA